METKRRKRPRNSMQRAKRSTTSNRLKDKLPPVPASTPELEQAASHGNPRAASEDAQPPAYASSQLRATGAHSPPDDNRFLDSMSELTKQYAQDLYSQLESYISDVYKRVGL